MVNLRERIESWKDLIRFITYYFSIQRLMRTLFVPWRRDDYRTKERGFWALLEGFAFEFFSRVFGALVRGGTILVGMVSLLFALLSFPLFLLFPIRVRYEQLSKFGSIGKNWSYPITFYLDAHGRDLRFLPEVLVIDHDKGIEKIERILSRDTQQNVLVVGPQGVGKTTRLGYLARKMYRDLSTPKLNSKRLVELFPEELTKRDLELCLREAVDAGNIVLVIENIERFNILGIIEPYLDIHHFQVILTTDNESYHREFKHRANLMRVAEVVEFSPPNDEITMLYLIDYVERKGMRDRFPDETLAAIVILTNKLIMNDYQPEKSFDLLEELMTLENPVIMAGDVERIISEKTGVPLGVLRSDEREKLMNLEETLNRYVIGQEEATSAIVSSLKRSRLGIRNEERPIGSFLFLGTTGVGKTHTAKVLAQHYFGSSELVHRFDMSEYRDLSSLEHFMTFLGNAVEERPYSLVFFDELEKAHPDILNLLLQILDEGIMHTPDGRLINFRNTIIIATSNAGARYLMESGNVSEELLVQHIIREGIFRPELVNRFDAVVVFRPLKRSNIKKVVTLLLEELNVLLRKRHGIEVAPDPELIDALAREGHDFNFGLRPLRRLMQDKIETYVADLLLRDEIPESRVIHIDPAKIESRKEKKIDPRFLNA